LAQAPLETMADRTKIFEMQQPGANALAPPMKIGPNDALIVVDVQRDFCAGGALAVPGADEILPVVNSLIREATEAGAVVVATRDWHPPNHSSFRAFGGPWPQHCVQGAWGAEFHPDLRLPENAISVSKGVTPENDRYSDFDHTGLEEELRRRGVNRVLICGLAQDVCIKATALDAAERGFDTHVRLSATRPITPSGGEEALSEMRRADVKIEGD
jgi:nicotinamidase/pyrazinamidase